MNKIKQENAVLYPTVQQIYFPQFKKLISFIKIILQQKKCLKTKNKKSIVVKMQSDAYPLLLWFFLFALFSLQ